LLNRKVIVCSLVLCSNLYAQQLEKVIVTATRQDLPREFLSNSIDIITEEEITESGARTLAEVLQGRTSIYINEAGAHSGAASILMRGLPRGFSKIIIDDMEINDPTDINESFQVNQLSLTDIESIEIIKGTQSILYGSDSIGGVIKLNTKEGNLKKLSLKYGSYNTHGLDFLASKTDKNYTIKASASYTKTDGVSSYSELRDPNAEKDFYRNLTANFGLKYSISKDSLIRYQAKIVRSDYDIDSSIADIERNDDAKYHHDIHSLALAHKDIEFKTQYQEIERDSKGSYPYRTKGSELKSLITYKLTNNEFSTIIGLENTSYKSNDTYNSDQTAYLNSIFVSNNYNLNNTSSLNLGVRADEHKFYQENYTYSLGAVKRFTPVTKLFINHATGYKSPSLYQLTFGSSSNERLDPIKSRNYEIGLSHSGQKFFISVALFQNDIRNNIAYKVIRYENDDDFKSTGMDLNADYHFNNGLLLSNKLTINRSLYKADNSYVEKVPRTIFSASIRKDIANIKVNFSGEYIGQRNELTQTNPSYTIFHTNISYQNFSLKVINLLDKEYEQTLNYTSLGRSVYLSYHLNNL
jgi:vitamin B12 transporter